MTSQNPSKIDQKSIQKQTPCKIGPARPPTHGSSKTCQNEAYLGQNEHFLESLKFGGEPALTLEREAPHDGELIIA